MSHRVLVFGESENDTKAIKAFIQALCPSSRVQIRRRPLVLIKDARPENVRPQAELIARTVFAENQDEQVLCVFAHHDADSPGPSDELIAREIEIAVNGALRRAGLGHCSVHAVVPAWETENWLLLWPDVVGEHVASWRAPTEYRNRNVDVVANGKETLAAAVRPRGKKQRQRVREYRESDAPAIAQAVCEQGLAGNPAGKSASYDRFRASIAACCAAS